ncbi:MAG TPA: hypothetical protein PKO40_12935, partial [Dokdonella sp.]|uniref:hypothetical protein n=1 Tax=Dokdonella sp. TaxID=2291710 RepID=UPI002BCD53FD
QSQSLACIIHERARMIAEGEQGRFEQSGELFSPKRTPRQGPGPKRKARGAEMVVPLGRQATPRLGQKTRDGRASRETHVDALLK